MSTTTMIAIYFLVWWITLFAVLPFGVRSQHENGDVIAGSDPGAPSTHRVWHKLLWTTLIASVVFAIMYVVYVYDFIPYEFLRRISSPPNS